MKAGKKGIPWLALVAWGLVLALGWPARAGSVGAAGPDVNWAEPNDARLFSATWTSASLSAVLYNPAENPESVANGVTRTLSVSGRINVDSTGKVLGLSNVETDVKAVTETGAEVTELQQGMEISPWRHYSSLTDYGYVSVGLRFPMDPNRGYPLLLKEVSWTSYVLMYRQEQWTDVPFQVTGQWAQIVPGVKIQFTQATSQDGMYRYQFNGQFEGPGNPFISSPSVGEGQTLPGYVVTKIELLDTKGLAINPSGPGASSGGSVSGSVGSAACSGHGDCSTCGGVKTARFWVAVAPYEIKLPFVLTDIPVPTF